VEGGGEQQTRHTRMARVLRLCCGTLVTVMALYVAACFALFPLLTRQPRPRIILADDDPILASFFDSGPSCAKSDAVVSSAETCKTADKDFFFGLATAPAHVEDDLNDSWLEFAKGHDDVKPVIIVFSPIKCSYACTPTWFSTCVTVFWFSNSWPPMVKSVSSSMFTGKVNGGKCRSELGTIFQFQRNAYVFGQTPK
jgi:hypothetical protein